MKTAELTGSALDWAVTKCEGFDVGLNGGTWGVWGWATKWEQGGPIIEREKLDVFCSGNVWDASTGDRHPNVIKTGTTPLIAAMRCYVTSKLGEDIDIPKELL